MQPTSQKKRSPDGQQNENSGKAVVGLSVDELESFRDQCNEILPPDLADVLSALVRTHIKVIRLLESSRAGVRTLRKLIFGPRSEKTSKVIRDEDKGRSSPDDSDDNSRPDAPRRKLKRKGHGRRKASDQSGATDVFVPCTQVTPKQRCPLCERGKIYLLKDDGVELRFTGQSPIAVTRYNLQRCRCQLCGEVFAAQLPPDAGNNRYDETVTSTAAVMKYDASMPAQRLERLLQSYGVYLSDSVIWELLDGGATYVASIIEELKRVAAQDDIIYIDDTTNRIIGELSNAIPGRTGIFTTGVVTRTDDREIALYFTGRKHAGENLADLLALRSTSRPPPIRMADALSRNNPPTGEAILLNCLVHGRRNFVNVAHQFPDECRFVLESIRDVYRVEAFAKYKRMKPDERRSLHRRYSGPRMQRLKEWFDRQLDEKLVEPNSRLGKAIRYMQKRWKALTGFLEIPGAPLDSNLVERMLRKIVIGRKNYLFFKTERGAAVSDVYTSLFATCRLNGVDPFRYLTALLKNKARIQHRPEAWLPWNYQSALT